MTTIVIYCRRWVGSEEFETVVYKGSLPIDQLIEYMQTYPWIVSWRIF